MIYKVHKITKYGTFDSVVYCGQDYRFGDEQTTRSWLWKRVTCGLCLKRKFK